MTFVICQYYSLKRIFSQVLYNKLGLQRGMKYARILGEGVEMSIFCEFLGYVAGICSAIAFLPQTLKTIKHKDVHGLSLTSYIIYFVGILSWILYGAYLKSEQMVIFNMISLVFAGTIIYMIVRYKKRK